MKHTLQQARYIAATIVALACIALGAALLLGWVAIDPQLSPPKSAAAVVTGSRIEAGEWKWGKFPQPGDDRFVLAVAFPVDGGTTKAGELQVTKAVFDAQPVGSTLTVWYAADRPDIIVMGNPDGLTEKRSRYGELFGWLLLGLGAAGAVISGNRLHVARGGRSLL
jgi:hypothetical protein